MVDTHVLLWWLQSSRRISSDHAGLLEDPASRIWVSAVTVWEIGIKRTLGKLAFAAPIYESCRDAGFELLSIDVRHAERAGDLELHHRDPFDRMLIAQAQIEQMAIMTVDPIFAAYDVATI